MPSDQDLFDESTSEDRYVMLVIEFDGENGKLVMKGKSKAPGLGESGFFGVKKEGRRYTVVMGLGKEEYDDKDLPNPIKRMLGGGSGSFSAIMKLPPASLVIRKGENMPVSYNAYRGRAYARGWPILPREMYQEVIRYYLERMGTPLYL